MAEEEESGPDVDEAEMMQQLRQEVQNLTVSDHLLFMMHSLSALAVDRLGLTGEAGARRDLDEARLAIDAFKALVELVGRVRPPEEMAVHRDMLSQLQMNYVGVLGGGGSEDAPADTPADEPADEPVDPPADEPEDAPTGEPADTPADAPADTPGSED